MAVAAERKEQTVAQRQDAGVTPDQIHRHRHHGVTHDLADQEHIVIGEMQRIVGRNNQS